MSINGCCVETSSRAYLPDQGTNMTRNNEQGSDILSTNECFITSHEHRTRYSFMTRLPSPAQGLHVLFRLRGSAFENDTCGEMGAARVSFLHMDVSLKQHCCGRQPIDGRNDTCTSA